MVFDSSVVLAWLLHEPGSDAILALIPNAIISSVNAAETQSMLVRRGTEPKAAWRSILSSVRTVIPFDAGQAEVAGTLIRETIPYGLSVGDRACLALGLATKSPVYTADRAWAQLQVGADVRLVR